MGDVADNGNAQPFKRAPTVKDRERVQQRLGGMLMGAVTCVDNRNRQVTGEKMRRTRCGMTHDDGIRTHCSHRIKGVDERFAFRHTGARGCDGDDVGAKTFCGDFEAGAGASGRFEK